MVVLPPIKIPAKRNDNKNRKKQQWPSRIQSKIFENGLTWFDLDTVRDTYTLTRHKYIPLHKQTPEYFDSKRELTDDRILIPYKTDLDENKLTGYTEREPLYTKIDLYGRLSEIRRKERALKKGWSRLEHEEIDFRKSVELYSRFVVDNKIKREVSHKKIVYYRERTEVLRNETNIFRMENNSLREIIVRMKEEYKKLRMYYDFCSDAARIEGSFTPFSMIDRYLTIKETEEFVNNRLYKAFADSTRLYNDLKHEHSERDRILHYLRMRYNEVKTRYDEAFLQSERSQQFYNSVWNRCQIRIRRSHQCVQAISAIYKLIRSRTACEKYIPKTRTPERLVFISRNMEKLEGLSGIIQKMIEEEEVGRRFKGEVSSSDIVVTIKGSTLSSEGAAKDDDDDEAIDMNQIIEEEKMIQSNIDSLFCDWKTARIPTIKYSIENIMKAKASILTNASRLSNRLPSLMETKEFTNYIFKFKSEEKMSSYDKRKLYDERRRLSEAGKRTVCKRLRPLGRRYSPKIVGSDGQQNAVSGPDQKKVRKSGTKTVF
ncbi:uncharacterized protein LOC123322668 [Coccinella septempunctata]|uniref:uncharacterized protein LOC123322668 n=1 Tax=Coccinella septempunctata TaxID=41139 RepID=UPI001D096132|nr:uncharacterized protein LOC123322668 [Coccinella septempunctata]